MRENTTLSSTTRALAGGVALLCAFAASCVLQDAGADEARAAWLRTTLFDDHQLLLQRDPELVQRKMEKMARDPFRFLRGTAPQYFRDVTEPGRYQSEFVDAASARVLLVGDPHPENLGTQRAPDGALVLEWNDFDASLIGPYHFDVWRLALGIWTFTHMLAEAEGDHSIAMLAVREAAQGYVAEMGALSAGKPAERLSADEPSGRIIEDLFRRAKRDGDADDSLAENTFVDEKGRHLRAEKDASALRANTEAEGLVALSLSEWRHLQMTLSNYPQTLHSISNESFGGLKDAGRKYGSGVSSLPLLRYYVLLEGTSLDDDDDVLIELKEGRDPPPRAGLTEALPLRFENNAARIVYAQRHLQSSGDLDARLGYSGGTNGFKVRTLDGYQKGIRLHRVLSELESGDFVLEDILPLAQISGRLLARSHARTTNSVGASALLSIARMIDAQETKFVDEVADFADQAGAQLLRDFRLFQRMMEERTPLLLGFDVR